MIFSLSKRKRHNSLLNRPLLVLLSDGFGLLATIVEDKQGEIRVVTSARSRLIDPVESLVEVVGKLAVSYGKLPREAIMLHAHAIPSILELAIENVDALEKSKLQELVRWEMESIFGDLVPHDNLGWLMIGLGFISEAQRDELVTILEQKNLASQKKSRIGEVAIEHGFINRNQLEECLKVQDKLQLQDQRIRCGWNSIQPAKQIQWLATAISSAIHESWVSAFQTISSRASLGRTKLKVFYPFIGSSATQFPDVYSGEEVYVLELHRPYLVLLRYLDGHVTLCLTLECSNDTPQLDDVETLISNADIPDNQNIHVLVSSPERNSLRNELKAISQYSFTQLERELSPPSNLPGDVSTPEALMIGGATVDYMNQNHQLIVPVEGQEPPPPIYRQPVARVAGVLLAFICLIGSIEAIFAYRTIKANAKLATIKEKVQRQEVVESDLRASRKAQARLDQLQVEYNSLLAEKKLIESVLVTRQNFTAEFLDILTRNLNDNLLINSITEAEWNKFVIEGWSFDQPSIDYFSRGLSRDLEAWNMIITENPSNLGRNSSGYSGYTFKFVIQKQPATLNTRTSAMQTAGKLR